MKLFNKIIILLGLICFLSACNGLNTIPKFKEKDSFVSFKKTSVSVKEDIGVIRLPVGMASINPKKVAVTYTVKDSSAKQGINYSLVEKSGVLNFDGASREGYIEIKINKDPNFTGDLVFSVMLSSAGDLNIGYEKECIVTIQDLDHPLSKLFGEYTANGLEWGNNLSWKVSIVKNGESLKSVKIYNIAPGYARDFDYHNNDNGFIANVVFDQDNMIKGLNIPVGQSPNIKFNRDNKEYDFVFASYNPETDIVNNSTGNVSVIFENDMLKFVDGYGVVVPPLGNYDILMPGVTLSKN